jgi:two-component system, NarL family, sensor histidine kinase EvgS
VRSAFVSTVSHELRTPLTGLTSVVELMDKTRLESDQRDMLGIMKSSVQIMLRLINDILLFSKVY